MIVRPLRIVVALLALQSLALCQGEQDTDSTGEAGLRRDGKPKPVMVAKFTNEKIVIDGIISEAAWETASVVSGFTQKEPEDGKPSTQLTKVRVLYDKRNLYISAYCYDTDPDKIIINDINRDFDIQEQDYFAVVLDTFNDDRNGYYLGATILGNQRDIQFFDEGRTQNVNWDGVWYSQGHRVEDGYTVEISIPFNTLRFNQQSAQIWGAQFIRRIRRRNEVGFWSPISRRYTGISAVALAGELRGIENVEPGRNLQVKPYGLAGVESFASRGKDADGNFQGGFDVKYGLTAGLVADLTVNTDFSQVEADAQQVNLTRFPLFFAEKRDFFLENSGIFQFGSLQNDEALLFHSRTIGLVKGEKIPILGGGRLTGRAGDYYLGMLNMQTRSHEAEPATNFSVARLRRNFLRNSTIGAMFLNKQSSLPNRYNRAFGGDGEFLFLRNNLRFSGGLARTQTYGRSRDDGLGKIEGEYQTNLMLFQSTYVDIGKNFNPEMGFVRRPGRRLINNEFQLKPRLSPESQVGRFVRDVFWTEMSNYIMLPDGHPETKFLRSEVRLSFQNASELGTRYEQNFEHLSTPFEVSRGIFLPVGDYRFNASKVWYTSDESKMLSGNINYFWGDFYSGTRRETTFGFKVRPSYHFSTSVSYDHNDVKLPEGSFHTDLASLRLDYAFNARTFLNAFVQYNSDANQLSSNIRFRFIHHPLSDIFVVYNDVRDHRRGTTDWALTLKYTHLLNF